MEFAENEQHVFLAAGVPLSDEAWLPMQAGESICVQDGGGCGFGEPITMRPVQSLSSLVLEAPQ